MGDMERITLGDYMRLDNIDEVFQGVQTVSPVLFDIKHSGVSESNKRLCLFVYSLSERVKDWLNTLPSDTMAT